MVAIGAKGRQGYCGGARRVQNAPSSSYAQSSSSSGSYRSARSNLSGSSYHTARSNSSGSYHSARSHLGSLRNNRQVRLNRPPHVIINMEQMEARFGRLQVQRSSRWTRLRNRLRNIVWEIEGYPYTFQFVVILIVVIVWFWTLSLGRN